MDQPGIVSSALQVTTADGEILHVQRFTAATEPGAPPLLLLHGLAEDGRVFYPAHGQGLAPFLAAAGYCVYVPDLRGHGQSTPLLEPGVAITPHAISCHDLPALLDHLSKRHPGQYWAGLAHASGGLWLAGSLIRQPHWLQRCAGLAYFATRRAPAAQARYRQRILNALWRGVAAPLARIKGYVPAIALGAGSQNESWRLPHEVFDWLQRSDWRDLTDGFDYASGLDGLHWPPGLYLAGKADRIMGAQADVRAFARELGPHDVQLVLLEQGSGCSRNYGHTDLLTHAQAALDHFPLVQDWLQQQYNRVTALDRNHPDNREEDRPCTTS